MIETTSTKILYEKLSIASRQFKNAKSREERIALSNYIYCLLDSIKIVSNEEIDPILKDIYGNYKNITLFNKKIDGHLDKVLRNFVISKDFHKDFFEKMFRKTTKRIKFLEEDEYSGITTLSEGDFYNIFFEFMSKLGLSKYFDKFVKDHRIYNTNVQFDINTFGYTLFNPISKDSDIFIEGLEYDIFSMYILAHEFGHVYDLNHFNNNIADYNKYVYESFNGEAISKTFERLFIDFLLDNNILVDEAKDQLFDMINYNYEYIVSSYIISLLPDILLIDGSYQDLSRTKIYKLVERNFKEKNSIRKFINKSCNFDVSETFTYSYGDIYSIFLKEMVKNNDYKLDVLEEIFEYRNSLFKEEMLNKFNITPDNYVKLYEKDIDILKKKTN